MALVIQAKKSEWTTAENKGLKPIWYPEFFLKPSLNHSVFTSTLAPTLALDANTVEERVYDRTVGALATIGWALTNKEPRDTEWKKKNRKTERQKDRIFDL